MTEKVSPQIIDEVPGFGPGAAVVDPALYGPADGLGTDLHDRLSESMPYHVKDSTADSARRAYDDLVKDGAPTDTLTSAREIIRDGTYNGEPISIPDIHRDAQSFVDERRWLSAMLARKPEVAKTILDKKVVGFHATRSFALAGMIEEGAMLSGRALKESGKASITGAKDSSPTGDGQKTMSFATLDETKHNVELWGGKVEVRERSDAEVVADLETTANEYEAIAAEHQEGSSHTAMFGAAASDMRKAIEDFKANPKTLQATLMRLNFPVAVGISAKGVIDAENRREGNGRILYGVSAMGEFRLGVDQVPITDLPVIAVPRGENDRIINGVKAVLEKFDHKGVEVISLEDLTESIPGVTEPLMRY